MRKFINITVDILIMLYIIGYFVAVVGYDYSLDTSQQIGFILLAFISWLIVFLEDMEK